MPRDSPVNTFETKKLAKQKYTERQIDKFVKWSWEIKGKVKYKDIVKLQDKYEMKFYGRRKEQ